MENSSLGPTQIPRRLANSRPIPGKSAPPAIPCIRGGTAVRESESFRKASGSFSFGNREPLPSPPSPRSNRYFPRRENDSGFSPSFRSPKRMGLTPPAPVIATDRKQTGPRCSRLYRLSSARFLTSKIDRDFDVRKAAPRRRARPIFRDRFGLRDVVHSARVVNEASRVNLSVVRANIIA